ncbi:helix-turn-helix domain-containing protein [Hymenobacter cellulosilyticus]|uniref:helix-turn-helix domain-containing protein n=1 Tax=Hymenobacter cellulosilyticus TaxID=2932248 RepID=UPI0028803777|nr:helix-turn-helix domain-containing protein [Hymenobacter cellulosilyticus]
MPVLAQYFLQYFAARLKKRLPGLDAECLRLLQAYDWPGNVRELKNVLERAAILTPDNELVAAGLLPTEFYTLPDAIRATDDPHDRSLRAVEARHIREVLAEVDGNKTEAARQLGIGLTTLYRKLQEYGLSF